MFYFQAKKKSPKKYFELKSEKKKKKNWNRTKQRTASPTSSPWQAQHITEEANLQILKKEPSKSLNQKPQITKG